MQRYSNNLIKYRRTTPFNEEKGLGLYQENTDKSNRPQSTDH
jgi:hypothetical protein